MAAIHTARDAPQRIEPPSPTATYVQLLIVERRGCPSRRTMRERDQRLRCAVSSYLRSGQVLNLGAVAVFDDLGNPAAMAMLVIALITEDADGPGLAHQRRKFVHLLARLRRLQMRGVNFLQHVKLAAARGEAAVLRRTQSTQMQIGNAAFVETGSELGFRETGTAG